MRNIINDIVLILHVEIVPVVVGGIFLCSGSKCTTEPWAKIIHFHVLKLTDNLMNTMMSFPLNVNNPLSNIR